MTVVSINGWLLSVSATVKPSWSADDGLVLEIEGPAAVSARDIYGCASDAEMRVVETATGYEFSASGDVVVVDIGGEGSPAYVRFHARKLEERQ